MLRDLLWNQTLIRYSRRIKQLVEKEQWKLGIPYSPQSGVPNKIEPILEWSSLTPIEHHSNPKTKKLNLPNLELTHIQINPKTNSCPQILKPSKWSARNQFETRRVESTIDSWTVILREVLQSHIWSSWSMSMTFMKRKLLEVMKSWAHAIQSATGVMKVPSQTEAAAVVAKRIGSKSLDYSLLHSPATSMLTKSLRSLKQSESEEDHSKR